MPIPFDLNDKRWISPAKLCFFHLSPGPYRSIPGLYRVLPVLEPNSPSSYSSSLSFSPCPHRVLTASSEICNAALKYLLLLWNIYCRSEIYITALKILLLHQNIYCHSEICYPDVMYTFANHHYTVKYGHRPTNGSIAASYRPPVLLPCSYRVLTMCHRLYPPGENVLSMSKTFAGSRRVLPAVNGPLTCSPIAQRPAMCPHRVPPSARNLPHGGTR